MAMAIDRLGRSERPRTVFVLTANALFGVLVVLVIVALSTSGAVKTAGASEGAAFLVGLLHVAFGITAAAVRACAPFQEAEEADDVRRQGRALLLGAVILVAAGSSLILLSLAGPGGVVRPAAALLCALLLNAVAAVLAAMRWPLLDEMDRTLTNETARLGLRWTALFGGTWAMLAHLGFVAGPAPLDWLTMFGGFGFAASMVELARRGALARRGSSGRRTEAG